MNVDEKRRYRRSDKLRLSSDAKILVELMKKQPQQLDELCKNAGIHQTLFYRMRRLFTNKGILKETSKGYALFFYKDLETEMDPFLKERKDWGWTEIPLDWLAVQFGRHPDDEEFNEVWPRLFRKYDLAPGPKIKRGGVSYETVEEAMRRTAREEEQRMRAWKLG